MNIKRLTILTTTLALLFAVAVYAQDEDKGRSPKEIEETEITRGEEVTEGAETTSTEEESPPEVSRREQFQIRQAEAQQRRTEISQREERVRAERAEALEAREARIVELRQEAMERMNEQMQARTEQLGERLNTVNDNKTDAYLNQLDALEGIFDNILDRIEGTSRTAGADLDAVYEAGEEATDRINSAREAVLNQKAKIYTSEIESPETLGEALRGMINEFRTDHQALRENHLFPAREAVRGALSELRQAATGFNVGSGEEVEEEEEQEEEQEAATEEEDVVPDEAEEGVEEDVQE